MARYTGPMTKKSRRLGVDLVGEDKAFEKSDGDGARFRLRLYEDNKPFHEKSRMQ